MLSYNPYIAGNPVHGQGQFIGRSDTLRDVEQTLRNPSANALVLFGQRRIGKTSVLLHIKQALRAKEEFMPVYFDLQDKAALPLSQVLYQLAQVMAQTTVALMPDRRKFDPEGIFFRETFIPRAVEACQNRGLVLLLDEFDVLDMPQQKRAGSTFFPYLLEWMRSATGMQFVFVLGRRPEELSTDTLSAFKGILSRRVSLMKQEDTAAIIRQSEAEQNRSLCWSDAAVQRVWYWTQGHPYFSQLLCSEVWETAMENEDFGGFGVDEDEEAAQELPLIEAAQVDAAIDGAIEQGANALQWIWNGLPPAERIVMAAMSEAEGEQISQDELAEILNRSKVRLILRELDLAPETLIAWDLLRRVDAEVYRFAIPLLRRWVATEKPLRRVKANLDSLEPLADSLYQSAEGYSKIGNVDEAERSLRNALDVNPYHFRARLLLGKVLLAKGNPAAAVEELKPAYEFDPRSAKSRLITALIALADAKEEQKQQLALYDQVLDIEPSQPTALKKKGSIKRRQATEYIRHGDLDSALELYEEIGDREGIENVTALKYRQEAEQNLIAAQEYEESEDWNAAVALYQQLLAEFPDDGVWRGRLEIAQLQQHLAGLYARATTALNQGNRDAAQELFAEIIGIEPTYKDAWRCLGIAAKGIDVNELLEQKQDVAEQLDDLKQKTVPKPSRLLLGFLVALWFAFLLVGGRTLYDFGRDKGYDEGQLTVMTPTPTAIPIPESTAVLLTRIELRSEGISISDDEFRLEFELNSDGRPQQYIENEFEAKTLKNAQGHADTVVIDHATGLVWQQSGSEAPMAYEDAEAYIRTLNEERFAGFGDWRLPTVPELLSLVEAEKQSNDLYISPFFDNTQGWCWSIDKRRKKNGNLSESTWGVGFDLGCVGWGGFGSNGYVRAVRS